MKLAGAVALLMMSCILLTITLLVTNTMKHRSRNLHRPTRFSIMNKKGKSVKSAYDGARKHSRLDRKMRAFMEIALNRAESLNEQCSLVLKEDLSTTAYLFFDETVLYCPVAHSSNGAQFAKELLDKGLWSPYDGPMRDIVSINITKEHSDYPTKLLVVQHPLERIYSCYVENFEGGVKPNYYNAYGRAMVQNFRKISSKKKKKKARQSLAKQSLAKQLLAKQLLAAVDLDIETEARKDNPYATPYGPTFSEFVQYVVSEYPDDEHWRPYHEHCAPCSIQYNFILRFDKLDEEGNLILQNTDVKEYLGEFVVHDPFYTNDVCTYFAELDPKLINALLDKYRIDFQLFTYDPTEYLKCTDYNKNHYDKLLIV